MKKSVVFAMLATPLFSFAQLTGVQNVANSFGGLVQSLIPILMALAVLMFFWGLVKYIANASDEAAKESGKTLMIWGMIALFVMVALWGILGWVQTQLDLTGTVVSSAPPDFIVPTATP